MCRNAMFFNVRLQFVLIKVNMKGYFGIHLTLWWQTYTFTNRLILVFLIYIMCILRTG